MASSQHTCLPSSALLGHCLLTPAPPPPPSHSTPPALLTQVLQTSKQLALWGGEPGGPSTFYDMIARDKEIVKVVLLLTGSIEGTKAEVLDYIATFNKYAFLWQQDLPSEYARFMATNPSLEVRSPGSRSTPGPPHSSKSTLGLACRLIGSLSSIATGVRG